MSRRLFESVTLLVLFEALILWLVALAPQHALSFDKAFSDFDQMSAPVVYGLGLSWGILGTGLPCMCILAFQIPPRHSLLILGLWGAAAAYVGYKCYEGMHSRRGIYYAGFCMIVFAAMATTFQAVRSDDKMRRINFMQRRALQEAHVEVVASVRDPFRGSTLRRWMREEGGGSGTPRRHQPCPTDSRSIESRHEPPTDWSHASTSLALCACQTPIGSIFRVP